MVPHRRDDSRRIAGGPEGESSDTRPRVFVWGEPVEEEPSLIRRFVNRWRRGAGSPGPGNDSPPRVVRPVPGPRLPGDLPAGGGGATVPARDASAGWEPPDLTGAEVSTPPEISPPSNRGPGPLYRATLQLLPGRLRPLDPDIVREEIRFVRPPGEVATVTLGWAEGEPPEHVTVNHPTVQDRHARMSFVERRWLIESLVAAHPVRVNGEALPAGAAPRVLQSGDEVRLGDATFHFLMP